MAWSSMSEPPQTAMVKRCDNAAWPKLITSLLLVDEVGALEVSARHLRGLVGRARESGLAVLLTTTGRRELRTLWGRHQRA